MIPSASRFFNFADETFGISSVVCSGQSLVSRTSRVNSLIWIDVK